MALSANTVIEVQGGVGADTNGGGFVTGASGTDWSQQASPQYSVTDGVTAGTTTITSLTANFGTDVVGNLIYVQGGTGAVAAGWYQIISRTNATTIVVDRATGLTAGTGVTLKIGGALATIGAGLALMTVSGMTMYVKNTATYSIGTGLTWPAGPNYGAETRMVGYTTTRGDGGRAIVKATAAIVGLTMGQSGCGVENFEFDGNSTGTTGILVSASFMPSVYNVWAHHWTAEGINATSNLAAISRCEVSNCVGTNGALAIASGCTLIFCYSHDNTKSGFYTAANSNVDYCVSANNTGANSHGFSSQYGTAFMGCIAYNNAGSGFFFGTPIAAPMTNCIAVSNGLYGVNLGLTGSPSLPWINYNAFYNNTSGARNGIGAGANDVTLTGVPFTNAAGGDYSLNNTVGQGAACRSVGFPGATLYGTGYADIGPLRHQDPSASTNIYPIFD